MAITCASIHVLCEESVSIDSDSFASWSPGWYTLIPREENRALLTDPEASSKKAKALSKTLHKTVLWFFMFDEDVLCFALYSDGKTAAAFNALSSDKNLSKIPALVGLEESYRKRLSKILTCADIELQIQLLEEFFGVKLLLYPEMLAEDPDCAVQIKNTVLFKRFEAENKVPSGKSSPLQVMLLFEQDGVLYDSDWSHKYHQQEGCLWVFQKHYWLYACEKATGAEEKPVCFRNGQLEFISDEEMLKHGTDQRYNVTRSENPLFQHVDFYDKLLFSEDAPQPYTGKTIRLPRGFYGLGFDEKKRFLVYNEKSSFAWIDENGKLMAKQHVRGDIIDHDGDYLLTWEEKWDTVEINGISILKRWYGIIRGYRLFYK